MKTVFLISNIGEYGKLMAFCIDNDIRVFRTYWDEREKGDRCYLIDWKDKSCYFSRKEYWLEQGYDIKIPILEVCEYGKYKIVGEIQVPAKEYFEEVNNE